MSNPAVSIYSPQADSPAISSEHIIIIGSGPVGVKLAVELLRLQPLATLTLFGNEPFAPYNRVQLSSVLAGEIARTAIDLSLPDPVSHPNFRFIISAITEIDREHKRLIDSLGNQHPYHKLIVATGSRPFVPSIPGAQQQGVYTFRNLKDTEALYARISSSRHVVVVGGGLLGLEAAKALQRFNTRITLIQQGPRLMNRQLDDEASTRLHQKIEQLDIDVVINSGVRVVHGNNRVEAVTTRCGQKIPCDTVLFCTGITTNSELARTANLKVGRGIIIDDQMRTSEPDIYALGECCEHRGQTYGLVAPGLEQAAILANVLTGGDARYQGSLLVSQLKVLGEQVFSMGEIADFPRHGRQRGLVYQQGDNYRKLVIHNGQLIGALAIGEWSELHRLRDLFKRREPVTRLQQIVFRLRGQLWFDQSGKDIKLWPAQAMVCQCNSVNRGDISQAIDQGCNDLARLGKMTDAGTVCGSCRPLLQQLLGDHSPPEKTRGSLISRTGTLHSQ